MRASESTTELVSNVLGKTVSRNFDRIKKSAGSEGDPPSDLLVFSHLRWNFVYQRPQHLLSRAAKGTSLRRVFFIEEPIWTREGEPRLELQTPEENLIVAVPHLPEGSHADEWQRRLIDQLIVDNRVDRFFAWYYTPMALGFTRHLRPIGIAYDCMDELSNFKFAPPELCAREKELLDKADVVFTGGHSLYEAKKHRHPNIHPFPSSVDKTHFARARKATSEPADQASIPGPRIGFFGVIDERFDIALIDEAARLRPDWHFVFIGPVVKIDPATLPRHANVHYLGGKSYAELPAYLAGWDVAILPFARNEATRFISPTKTPEYLAAGKPVVSTSIRDVVTPYADLELVRIADSAPDFVKAIEASLQDADEKWLNKVDLFLSRLSWDDTWKRMSTLLLASARQPAQLAL